MRVLFICKKNECYGFSSYSKKSSGLYNSTHFIVEALRAKNSALIDARVVEVVDNNCIDRQVSEYEPDICIIEALWVVPEKFEVLKKLHPSVKWFVHMHSGIPFLAIEGIATEWLYAYTKRGVGIITNSYETQQALLSFLPDSSLYFLPNVYFFKPQTPANGCGDSINVGCFGAIRPMKNQLIQAMAAIKFAKQKNKYLFFFINGARVETGGEPVLKNIHNLFGSTQGAELIELPWVDPKRFISTLRFVDIGLQVSMTETFNIISADYVAAGIPVVASRAIAWISGWCKADENSVDDIVRKMHLVWRHRWLIKWNRWLLERQSNRSAKLWRLFVESQCL